MKIRIKSFNGELPSYLTEGKVYDVKPNENGTGCLIVNDNGAEGYTCFENTAHLNGGSWEIVGDNITDSVADIKHHVSPNMRVSDERA